MTAHRTDSFYLERIAQLMDERDGARASVQRIIKENVGLKDEVYRLKRCMVGMGGRLIDIATDRRAYEEQDYN